MRHKQLYLIVNFEFSFIPGLVQMYNNNLYCFGVSYFYHLLFDGIFWLYKHTLNETMKIYKRNSLCNKRKTNMLYVWATMAWNTKIVISLTFKMHPQVGSSSVLENFLFLYHFISNAEDETYKEYLQRIIENRLPGKKIDTNLWIIFYFLFFFKFPILKFQTFFFNFT